MATEVTIHSFVVQPDSWPGKTAVWAAWLTNWVTGLVYPAGSCSWSPVPQRTPGLAAGRIVAAIAVSDTVLMTVLAMLEPNLRPPVTHRCTRTRSAFRPWVTTPWGRSRFDWFPGRLARPPRIRDLALRPAPGDPRATNASR